MSDRNPYDAPKASVSTSTNDTYQPKFFSTKGRIGRIRYLAYGFGLYALMIPFGFLAGLLGAEGNSLILGLILVPVYAISIIGFLIFTKRRFNDLNRSGWFAITMLIPIVNIITWIYVTFFAGTKTSNRFGPNPSKNTTLLWICGLALPVIAIIGILAAVALPAYADYAARATEAAALVK
jgi:uncharacterized membrane protein YhaH (DUF805 family)